MKISMLHVFILAVIILIVLLVLFNLPSAETKETITKEEPATGDFCGDGICSNSEDCNSCSSDCGECDTIKLTDKCQEPLTWCVEEQSCVDLTKDHCGKIKPFGQAAALEANEKWGGSRIYPASGESSKEGWLRMSFNVPKGAELSNPCYIFMRGEKSRELDSGSFFLDYGPQQIDSKEICELELTKGPADQCGGLMLQIDLVSMKESYDQITDNWQDFFKCVPGVASEFCKTECQTMLDLLMSQVRSPIEINS